MSTPLHDAYIWQPLEIELLETSPANATRLRAVLELLGTDVTLRQPASPQALLRALHAPHAEHSLLIITGHGDERGFRVPEIESRLRHQELAHIRDHLPADMLTPYMYLPHRDVINLCNMGGSAAMVDAFKRAGVRNYIAADGYPDTNAATLFLVHLIDTIQRGGMLLAEAWAEAVAYEPDAGLFTLSTYGGVERLG